MQYSKNGSLKSWPMESRSLLAREFDNLSSNVSLVAMDLPSKMDLHEIMTDGDLEEPG